MSRNTRNKKITNKLVNKGIGFVSDKLGKNTGTTVAPSPRAGSERNAQVRNKKTTDRAKENSILSPDEGCSARRFEKRKKTLGSRGGTRTKIVEVDPLCNAVEESIALTAGESSNNGIPENVLNDYVNVQYNISFALIPENSVADIQATIPQDQTKPTETLRRALQRQGAIVIASTGGVNHNPAVLAETTNRIRARRIGEIKRRLFTGDRSASGTGGVIASQAEAEAAGIDEDLIESTGGTLLSASDRNYYNVTELTIDNHQSPVSNNPMISNMVGANIVIAEPGGFSFNDDIKKLARRIGYKDVNTGRVLYRLDISFSGYNPSTGEWVSNIDIDIRKDFKIPFLTYYVIITKFEAEITNTGTQYKLDLAPIGASAFRAEDFIVDSTGVFTREVNTFGGFLDSLSEAMAKKRKEETTEATIRKQGIKREYEFIAPRSLRDATFYARKWAIQKSYISEELDKGSVVYNGKDIDMLTLLKSAMDDIPYVQELFIAKVNDQDNKQFVRPRVTFTTRFNVIYGKVAREIGDYYDMKIQIILEPFASFKKGSYTSDTLSDYTDIKSQIRRVEQMQNIGAIVRKYDYLNTSGNTEVIDFGINLSAFYYDSMDRNQDFPGIKGTGSGATPAEQKENLVDIEFRKSAQINLGGGLTGTPEIDDGLVTLLGGGTDFDTVKNGDYGPYDILGGGKGITPDVNSHSSTSSEMSATDVRKDRYLREYQDWLSRDQQQLNDMMVRGDPVWLLSPYASADLNRINPISNIIRPSTDKVIFININAPDQKNYMNHVASRTSNPNIIGGFYGVYRVTSMFSGGKFTQKINGYKINHLNYVEEGVRFEDIIASNTTTLSEAAGFLPGITQLHPDELKLSLPSVQLSPSIQEASDAFSDTISSRFSDVLEIRKKFE